MADLDKKIVICIVMLLAVAVFLPIYGVKEPARQEAAAVRIKREAAARGAELFVTNCVACHGKTGDNVPGKNLGQTQLNQAALVKIISRGIPGTAMPAFGNQEGGSLKKFEISDLVTLILGWDQPLIEEAIVHLQPPGGAAAPPPVVAGAKPAATPAPPAATPLARATTTTPAPARKPAPARTPAPAAATPAVKEPEATVTATPAVRAPQATSTPRPPAATTAAPAPAARATGGGDAEKGKTAYGARCAMCHGPDGGGALGPALKGRDAASMKDVVRKGKGVMPAMSATQLSDSDLENIGAFLTTLK